ncbi:MAG: sigma 54-interacting transcriptional regulator [Firmicutes bacterium]|jgi:transcriptional regulator with AAA-type ATPase domain/transcriptional regulatory protein LevR|nr:sigma 54-interacting transcriptional regulator [Bacillota bacterium]NBI62357.1 PRD domain-containing protein [Clostridiales bacterium]
MLRIDHVYLKLKELTEQLDRQALATGCGGFSAGELAESLGFDRSNVSRDLNKLAAMEKAVKVNGRPVRFLEKSAFEKMTQGMLKKEILTPGILTSFFSAGPEEPEKDDAFTFHNLVGAEGSLKSAVQQAKASILYPGNSLNILLTGATGVGKTTFAELIYKYAKEKKTIKESGKFITFNCSEYADNPQLLLDQIFGHVKGAFTGADQEKAGLIQQAEGGVLLLDEIHRLGPEGQEMLFMFIDKGRYRKLGESEHLRKGRVMLVAATTENPESHLLRTFARRFPMVIKIPDLDERPLRERCEFIKTFFSIEARGIKKPIAVDDEVMNMLLAYPCQANIGQLRADIQLICARGFLEHMTESGGEGGKDEEVYVETAMLPDHILEYFSQIGCAGISREIEELTEGHNTFLFREDNKVPDTGMAAHNKNQYHRIFAKYRRMLEKGQESHEINREIYKKINKYINESFAESIREMKGCQEGQPQKKRIYKEITPKIYNAVAAALDDALGHDCWEVELAIALAMHIEAMEYRPSSPRKRQISTSSQIQVGEQVARFIEQRLNLVLDEDEAQFISLIIENWNQPPEETGGHIGILLISLGEKAARGLVESARDIAHNEDIEYMLYAMGENDIDFSSKLLQKLRNADQGKGVIIFADLALPDMEEERLSQQVGSIIKVISPYSVPMLFEAARKAVRTDQNIEGLFDELVGAQINRCAKGPQGFARKETSVDRKVILTTCITGAGTAVKIADKIRDLIPGLKERGIDIISLDLAESKIDETTRHYADTALAVVGSVEIQIPGAPFIPLEDWILKDGAQQLKQLVQGSSAAAVDEEKEKIVRMLKDATVFLDIEKAYTEIMAAFEKLDIPRKENTERRKSLEVRFLLHMVCMLERVIQKLPIEYPDLAQRSQKQLAEFTQVKQAVSSIEQNFNIEIPDNEIGFIIDLICTQ